MSTPMTDYAVVRAAGKQYRVSAGQKIQIDQRPDLPGAEVRLNEVLFLRQGDTLSVGRPVLEGQEVVGEVVRHLRGKKVLVFKKRSKKGYKKLQGHRQDLTEILIKSIASTN